MKGVLHAGGSLNMMLKMVVKEQIKNIYAQNGEKYKEPSSISDIVIENGTFANDGNGILSLVDVDLSEYRKKVDTKTVRRNVALPSWLNYEA